MSALACSPAKTAIGDVNPPLNPLAPLLSASWPSCQVQLKLFNLNNEAHEGSIPRKAFSDELAAS
jgi:hypothetical protein